MEDLVEQLRARLRGRAPGRLNLPGLELREAAVLAPLVERDGEPRLLFTRRPGHLRHHAGQISFPGGTREPGDPTPLHTALRESEEELAIPPSSVDVLGMLDELPTVTEFRIIPFVGQLPPAFVCRPNPDEVEQLLEVPLRHLLRPGAGRVEKMAYQGREYDVHFFEFEAHVIWGATGRILRNLLDILLELPAGRALAAP